MKNNIIYTLLFILLSAFTTQDSGLRSIKNNSFTTGEELKYRVHYGFVNAGVATMKISDDLHTVNSRPCYKVDIYGKSVGVFDVFTKIRDNWGSYIDTAAILPQKAYRNIEEGKYRKYETTVFDQRRNNAEMIWLDKKTKKVKDKKTFATPSDVLDIVSGYYYMRTLDYSKYKKGDMVTLNAFFDEEVYNFKVRFSGREKLSTAVGEINTIILTPIIPENKLFNGENSVQVWISDDSNKIPLKIRANMFVGAVEIDIMSYKNSRN